MPETMKAAVVRTFGAPLTIEEMPIPTPGHGQVLVRIAASGVCHTDLHAANGDWPIKGSPHETDCRGFFRTLDDLTDLAQTAN